MEPEIQIRRAKPDDADIIARHRSAMFRDMGDINGDEATKLESEAITHLRLMLACRGYVGWLAESNGKVVAGGGALIRQELPRPGILSGGATAHIVNIYTEASHRRRGLARKIMLTILDWCERNHIATVTLAASEEGRPLYESLGFVSTTNMRWSGWKADRNS